MRTFESLERRNLTATVLFEPLHLAFRAQPIGDFNQDGYDDLAIIDAEQRARVYFGGEGGLDEANFIQHDLPNMVVANATNYDQFNDALGIVPPYYNPGIFSIQYLAENEELGIHLKIQHWIFDPEAPEFGIDDRNLVALTGSDFDGNGLDDQINARSISYAEKFVIGGLDPNNHGAVTMDDADFACRAGDREATDQVLAFFNVGSADINADGVTSFGDFLILSSNFGSEQDRSGGDLTCDRQVDFADFLILASNFGDRTF